VKEARNQSQFFNRKSISRNTTHRQRFKETSSIIINAAIIYGHKINSLMLICLVYYMRLMLGRTSLLLNCFYHACWA